MAPHYYTPYNEGLSVTTNGTTTVTMSGVSDAILAGSELVFGGEYPATVVSVDGVTLVVDVAIPAGVGLSLAYADPIIQEVGGLPADPPSETNVAFRLNDGWLQLNQANDGWTGLASSTTAPMDIYVATTGSDTASGKVGAPLATVTEALNRVPLHVRHEVTIHVAAGTYSGAVVVPSFVLQSNVVISGADMVATTPGAGIASGTFDASFGSPPYPHRFTVAGAGWTAGALIGGWFVEIMGGPLLGNLYPIVYNDTAMLILAFPQDGTHDLASCAFRLVRPSVTFSRTGSGDVVRAINSAAGGDGASSADFCCVVFDGIVFQSSAASQRLLRVRDANVFTRNCVFKDHATGGGILVSSLRGVLKMTDCLTFRDAVRTGDTVHVSRIASNGIMTRHGAYGGGTAVAINGATTTVGTGPTVSEGCFLANATGVSVDYADAVTLVGLAVAEALTGVSVTDTALVQLTECVFSASESNGVVLTRSAAVLNDTTVDGSGDCGVQMYAQSALRIEDGVNTISNNSWGVHMAPTVGSGLSYCQANAELVMGNADGDFVVDGSTAVDLAALRALTPKAVTDATYLNRLVQA